MTPSRPFPDDFEIPGGGLAEEAAAEATAVRERDETAEGDAKPSSLAEIEFLFLTPDEAARRERESGDGQEAGGVTLEPTATVEQETIEPVVVEPARPRTIEEALASDFLFAFDQRETADAGGEFDEREATASIVEPIAIIDVADQNRDTENVAAPTPTDDFFGFALLDEGREQLEHEIGKLRRELERHRSVLLELREGSSPLLPAPATRRPSDGSHLPATADVLAGMTTVDEAVEFRDTEAFRARLPKTSALLGLETAPDGTLLKPIDEENEPTFRAVAPIGRPRDRSVALLEYRPPSSESALLPQVVGLATEIHDVEAPVERKTDEIVIPVAWWNAIPAVMAFIAIAGGLGFVAFGMVRQASARATLQDAIHSAPIRIADLEGQLAATEGTFLSRFDGRFDYVRARVQDFVNIKNNAQELLTKRQVIDPRVLKLVDRAVERTPAVGWQRLTRATLATQAKSEDVEESWTVADAGRIDDPLYWEMLGDHYRMVGRKDDALAMFANVLRRRPAAARDVLAMLAEVRIDLAKSLTIIPPEPVAALQAVLFVRNEEGRREWQTHATQLLERLGAPRPDENGDDLAARGQLQLLLGRNDEASQSYELALKREPERNDFRLALAKLHYERKRFGECSALAERIIHTEPASSFGEEARVLRNKIELATGGRPGRTPATR